MRRYAWLPLCLAALALMLIGLGRGEYRAVKHHAQALCTACIGLTSDTGP